MIECDNLVKIYKTRDTEVMALQGLDLTIENTEFMAIIGASGSGKSTLLNILGGLDTPTMGSVAVDGRDLRKMNIIEVAAYKRETVGFVWQNNARNLIPYLTAQENIELVGRIGNKLDKEYCLRLIELVGLTARRKNKLGELSGGEQQRVAVARALVNNPRLIIADEPTGNLDPARSLEILLLLKKINELGTTVLVVTHEKPLVDQFSQRVIAIDGGRIISDGMDGYYDYESE